jgi:hypothetical protein
MWLLQLGALVVGLPSVQLQFPRSVIAWFRLRQFVFTSFEFRDMVKVELGFTAMLALIILLQVCGTHPGHTSQMRPSS